MKKQDYKLRIADTLLKKHLAAMGGVLIVGPKGCGKTSTAKQQAKSCVEFQDEDARSRLLSVANETPSRLLDGPKPRLFDEWQDAPKIWGSIRKSIDDINRSGLYILTGSSSQIVKTAHTGTGRISTMKMYPMSLYESGESSGEISLKALFEEKKISFGESKIDFDELIFAICRGGWPRSLMNNTPESQLMIAKIMFQQICTQDVSKISDSKRNPTIVENILKSYARNLCTLASTKTIVDDINNNYDITKPTYYDYLEDLKNLYIVENIDAWCPSIRSKTIIRSTEKKNLVDPSLAVAALGLSPKYFNTDFKTLGFLFECLCIRDLRIYSSSLGGKISYYHDKTGLEADCVLHLEDGRYALIEFKLGDSGIEDGAKHLLKIEKLVAKQNEESISKIRMPDLKIIIVGGGIAYQRNDGVFIIPIGCLRD